MRKDRMTRVASFAAMGFLACVTAVGASAQTRGIIISRQGDTLIVNGAEGKTTVLLTDSTDTKDDKGLFGLDKEHLSSTVLQPGLKVKVEGSTDDQGRVVAKTITVDGDDLETTSMIQGGLHPTAEQVEANRQAIETHSGKIATNRMATEANAQGVATNQQGVASNKSAIEQNIRDIQEQQDRFNSLSEYDLKAEETVNFGVGSTKITPADQEKLKKLAETAGGLKVYTVEVTGYADSSGDAAMNTKLSEARAKSVIIFLQQQGNIPIRYIVAPGAMGEYGAAAPNETKTGRAENRRVVVKVLVNKGLAGS